MEGPTDSTDDARVVTETIESPPAAAIVPPAPPRPCRITFHGFLPQSALRPLVEVSRQANRPASKCGPGWSGWAP